MKRANALPPAESGLQPRLLDLQHAASYLGVSFWSVRDWCLAGYLPTVELPALRPRQGERPKKTLRRVLVDREDLDRFIEQHKASARACSSGGTQIESGNSRDFVGPVSNMRPPRGGQP
jgi:hypothetical protein